MTRILFWNIENFSDDTINATTTAGTNRRDVILQHLRQLYNPLLPPSPATLLRDSPDIFAVVEVCGMRLKFGDRVAGEVMDQTLPPAAGVIQLLADINADPGIKNHGAWRLIPPIVSGQDGYREGVAIFYNSTNLIFTGPNLYNPTAAIPAVPPATRTGMSIPVGAGAPGNYPGTFANTLPAVAVHPLLPPVAAPIAARLPAGVLQNQLAGQWEFNTATGSPTPKLRFPGVGVDPSSPIVSGLAPAPTSMIGHGSLGTAAGTGKERSPFLVTFWDTINNREIQLLVYHSSPDSAVAATAMLGHIQELQPPTYPQVSVIAGDFNIDVTGPSVLAAFAYAPLTAHLLYAQQIQRPPLTPQVTATGATLPFLTFEKSYVYTMVYSIKNKKNPRDEDRSSKYYPYPYSTPYPSDNYPSFDGVSNEDSRPYQMLTLNADNIFIRYAPPLPPGPNNTTIVNLITGTPYAHPQVQNNYITGMPPPLPPPPRPLNAVTPLNGYVTFSPLVVITPAPVLRDRRLTPPPGGFPLGSIPYLSALFPYEPLLPVCPPAAAGFISQILLPKILNGMYYQDDNGRYNRFRNKDLYFKIQDTSDHLAIVTDV